MRRTIVFALVCLVLVVGRRAAAQSTGSIAGVVTDASGAVLPGVTVEAASPALIEKTRTVVTDAAGAYKLEALRPGTYSVTFGLPGFTSVKRDGIELTTGFTAAVDAKLSVGSVEETITVTGAAPMVDVQNVSARTVLTKTVLDNVVMNKSVVGYQAVLLGASTSTVRNQQDVAGNQGEFPTQIAINGGRDTDQMHLYDGLRLGAVASSTTGGGGYQRNYYPNTLMIQEIGLDTNNAPPNIETGGIQITYVPKDGGNQFTGSAVATGTGPKLQGRNLDDTLRSRGLLTEPGRIKRVFDFGVGVGGPIKSNRLWFYSAGRYWGAQNIVAGTYYNATANTGIYTPDLSRPGFNSLEIRDGSGRVTWQVSQKQKLSGFYGQQASCLCGFSIGATVAPEAALNQRYSGNLLTQATWSYVATNRLLFRAGASLSRSNVHSRPTEGNAPNALAYVEFPRNLAYDNRSGGQFNSDKVGFFNWNGKNVAFSTSYVTGSHAASVGVQWFGGGNNSYFPLTPPDIGLPAQLAVNRATPDAKPIPFQITEFVSSSRANRVNADIGVYAQDQWKLRRLTLNGGLRFDYLNSGTVGRCKPADLFTPERCTEGVRNQPKWKDLNPRVGAAYDLFGNGRTAVKVAIGRYVLYESTSLASAADPLNAISATTTRAWQDTNGDYRPDCNLAIPTANGECGAILNPLFGTLIPVTRYADSVSHGFDVRPYNWQTQLSVQQELRPGLSATVAYYRTSYGNFTVTDNLNVTSADYDPFCVTVPVDSRLPTGAGGSQRCGFYDVTAAALARGPNNLIRPAGDFGKQSEVYNGVNIAMNWRFGQGGLLSGGVSTGRTETNNCFVVDSPQQLTDCNAVLGWAAQRQVKFIGSYPLPWWQIRVSSTFQHFAGPVDNASLNLTRAQALTQTTLVRPLAGTSVTIPNLFAPNIKLDGPLNQVDVRIARDFRFGSRRMRAQVDVGNLFNSNAVLTVATAYSPGTAGWLRPGGVLSARIIKFGMTADF